MSGKDVTTPVFSAIAVPLPVTVWAQQSTYTEAGSRAGVPVPTDGEGASRMAIEARGAQVAGGGIDVRSQRGGFAARSGATDIAGTFRVDQGASFVWRKASVVAGVTTNSAWRGWEPPRSVTRYQPILVCDSATTTPRLSKDPSAVTLASGVVLVAVEVYDTSQASPYQIAIWSRSGVSDAWARLGSPYGSTTAPTTPYRPVLLSLPSGRVLLFYILYDSVLVNYPVSGWYSDDDGATWSVIGDGLTSGIMLEAPASMRAAYKDGQISLLIPTASYVYQFASSDSGNSFDAVSALVLTVTSLDVTAVASGFLISYCTTAPATLARLVGDAYDKFSTISGSPIPIEGAKGGTIALTTDETGMVYAYLRPSSVTQGRLDPYLSYDGGLTWTEPGDLLSTVYMSTTTYPTNYSVTAVRGQILMIGNNVSSVSTYDASLSCWSLGGYTTVSMPRYMRVFGQAAVQGWDQYYCPIELPANVGWTRTTSGGTESIATGGLVTTTAAQTNYYTVNPAGSYTRGIIARFVLSVAVGAALGQELSAELILDSGGATDTGIRIEWTTSTWRLWDLGAGAQVGATQTYTAGTVEVLVSIVARTVVTAWRRVDTTAESGVRDFTVGPTTTTLTQAALAALFVVRWGCIASGTRTATWYEVAYAFSVNVGGLATTSPDNLFGRPYATGKSGVYAGQNVTIQARGGPTWLGESWSIQPRADSALERAITLPSPRMPWVSTTTSEIVALLIDDGVALGTVERASPGLIAIYLGECNAETVEIKRRNVGGASWVSMGTADRCQGLTGLVYSTLNNTIRPDSGGSGQYIRANEFAGSWFVDTTATVNTYQIESNTEGRWTADARLRPVLTLTATAGATTGQTAGKILPKDSVILVDLTGYDTPALQLTLAAPNGTAVRCGVLRIARVQGLGHRYDWGRTVDLGVGVELGEQRDGTRRSRGSAPARRMVSVSWATTAIDQTDADRWGDPDYIRGSDLRDSPAIGSVAGTAYALDGLMREIDGSDTPIVYLPAVPMGSGIRLLNRRHQMIFGRIVSDLSIESVLGEESDTELVRVATVEIEEEL